MPNVQHSALTGAEQHEPKGADAASVDTVYKSDGAGSGAWVKVAADEVTVADAGGFYTASDVEALLQEIGPLTTSVNPQYGEMVIIGNGTATTITTVSTPVQITAGWATGLVDGVTFDTDHLVVGLDGVYEFNCALSFTGQVNDTFNFEFYRDVGGGYVAFGKGAIRRQTASATAEGALALMATLSVDAGDKIALFVENVATSGNPTITDALMFAHRIKAE